TQRALRNDGFLFCSLVSLVVLVSLVFDRALVSGGPEMGTNRSTRRTWMKTAAGLAAGVAASDWLSLDGFAATPPVPPATASGVVTASATKTIVETTAGKVRGFTRSGINTFKGIPYARNTAGT